MTLMPTSISNRLAISSSASSTSMLSTLVVGIAPVRSADSRKGSSVLIFSRLAEGVETKDELDKVTQLGIDMIQGYYFSRPLEGGALLELLKGNG